VPPVPLYKILYIIVMFLLIKYTDDNTDEHTNDNKITIQVNNTTDSKDHNTDDKMLLYVRNHK
jgi:hypothetical protein